MAGSLAGRVALVVGASSGIGEATALALAQEGASVAVAARRADRLNELVGRIEQAGGKALALPGDATDEAAARGFVADTVAQFGRIDILVNSAGVVRPGGLANTDTAVWREVMEINFMASLYTSAAAVQHMLQQGEGDIVNVSSTAGRRSAGIFGPYSASKHALNSMSEGSRQELGEHGIRVCIIEPGATTTEVADSIPNQAIRDSMRQHVSKDGAMKSEDIANAILFAVALPRRANVCEILIRPTIDVTPGVN